MWPPRAGHALCGILQSHAVSLVVRIDLRYRSLFHLFDDHPPRRAPGIQVAPTEGKRAQVGAIGNLGASPQRECRRAFRLRIDATQHNSVPRASALILIVHG